MGGEGCALEGVGREGCETMYRGAQPARCPASAGDQSGKATGLGDHDLCGQQVTVPSLGEGTEAEGHDVMWPKFTHRTLNCKANMDGRQDGEGWETLDEGFSNVIKETFLQRNLF